MTKLFLQILNMSLSATWLVLAVIALRFLLKKAPKWVNVLLWGLVAFRLVCPFTLESALSLIPSAEVISPEIMMDRTPTIHTGVESLNRVVNPVITEAFAPEPIASANPLQILIPAASLIWCIGVGLMLLYTLISYARLQYRVRMAIRVKGNIYLSEFVASPFVLGVFRPRIYLPYHMSEQDRHHVIAHERAHIARRDHWWKPLGFLLLSIHWFNPLMWLAYILLCRDIELACDERVIQTLGADQRADYSQALLHCSIPHRTIAACPIAFGEVGVKERVKNVLRYQKPAFWVIAISLVVILIVSVCFLTDPKVDDPFGSTYEVEEIVYSSGNISMVYYPETCPRYRLTADGALDILEDLDSDNWLHPGLLEEFTLTEENFDNYFIVSSIWNGSSPQELRNNNDRAWQVFVSPETSGSGFQYLLLQKNGDLYITQGTYHGEPSATDVLITNIHHVFKLTQEDGNSSEEAPAMSLLGKTFHVSQVLYGDPHYSSTWLQIGIPFFSVTQNCFLLTRDALPITAPTDPPAAWIEAGQFETLELTQDNFERYIRDDEGDQLARQLRKDNQQTWRVISTDDTLYYLLRQENGDIYLAYGTHDPEGMQDWASDDSTIRFLVQLRVSPDSDWAVAMTPHHISRTSAFLSFRQVGTVADGSLSFGEDYSIQREVDGTWQELPHDPEKKVFNTIAHVIVSDSHAYDQFDWTDIYGPLSDGHYRIRKTVTLSKRPGNSESRDYFAEFTIGGSVEDAVFLALEDISPTGLTARETFFVPDAEVVVDHFWLEAFQNGQWSYLEPTEQIEPIFHGVKRNIPTTYRNGSNVMELDWSSLYGQLPPGTYRICRDYTFYDGLDISIRTGYAEFTTAPVWNIGLLVDILSENDIYVSFLTEEPFREGEYELVGAALQYKQFSVWEDIFADHDLPEPQDIQHYRYGISSGYGFHFGSDYHQMTDTEYRIGLRIKHNLPDGSEEYNTLYEYFNPTDYAWGVSMSLRDFSPTGVALELYNNKLLPTTALSYCRGWKLQQRKNNQWVDLANQPDTSDYPAEPIPATQATEYIRWNTPLPNGTYRLVKDILRHHGTGDSDTRQIYSVFIIDSNPDDASSAQAAVSPDLGVELFLDQISETGITLNLLPEEGATAGEYFLDGSALQYQDSSGNWTDALPMNKPPEGQDIVTELPSFSLLWDEKMYRLAEGEHRIAVRIRHLLPDGTSEYGTIYEYFDPASYTWGASLEVTNISCSVGEVFVDYRQTFTKTLPNGSLRESSLLELQKWENDQWIKLQQKFGSSDLSEISVRTPGTHSGGWNLLALYDGITSGTYRLVSYITRHYETGETQTRPVSAVFELPESIDS